MSKGHLIILFGQSDVLFNFFFLRQELSWPLRSSAYKLIVVYPSPLFALWTRTSVISLIEKCQSLIDETPLLDPASNVCERSSVTRVSHVQIPTTRNVCVCSILFVEPYKREHMSKFEFIAMWITFWTRLNWRSWTANVVLIELFCNVF